MLELKLIPGSFTVCQVNDISEIQFDRQYVFVGKTEEELSLVCQTEDVPEYCNKREDGWKAFRVEGVLEFSLIGIIAGISKLLAEYQISIYVVSTYNTDYVFVKDQYFTRTIQILSEAGYRFI